jgi:hypothetical protein
MAQCKTAVQSFERTYLCISNLDNGTFSRTIVSVWNSWPLYLHPTTRFLFDTVLQNIFECFMIFFQVFQASILTPEFRQSSRNFRPSISKHVRMLHIRFFSKSLRLRLSFVNWRCHFKKGVNSVDSKCGLSPFWSDIVNYSMSKSSKL